MEIFNTILLFLSLFMIVTESKMFLVKTKSKPKEPGSDYTETGFLHHDGRTDKFHINNDNLLKMLTSGNEAAHGLPGTDRIDGQRPLPVGPPLPGTDRIDGQRPLPVGPRLPDSDRIDGQRPLLGHPLPGTDRIDGQRPLPVGPPLPGTDRIDGQRPLPVGPRRSNMNRALIPVPSQRKTFNRHTFAREVREQPPIMTTDYEVLVDDDGSYTDVDLDLDQLNAGTDDLVENNKRKIFHRATFSRNPQKHEESGHEGLSESQRFFMERLMTEG